MSASNPSLPRLSRLRIFPDGIQRTSDEVRYCPIRRSMSACILAEAKPASSSSISPAIRDFFSEDFISGLCGKIRAWRQIPELPHNRKYKECSAESDCSAPAHHEQPPTPH